MPANGKPAEEAPACGTSAKGRMLLHISAENRKLAFMADNIALVAMHLLARLFKLAFLADIFDDATAAMLARKVGSRFLTNGSDGQECQLVLLGLQSEQNALDSVDQEIQAEDSGQHFDGSGCNLVG